MWKTPEQRGVHLAVRLWIWSWLPIACALASGAAAAPPPGLPADPLPAGFLPREGASLARSPGGARLYVADEPNSAIYVIATNDIGPGMEHVARRVSVPGPPAQIVVLRSIVLVTIRDPGLVVAFVPDDFSGLEERWRVTVPYDAWGIAVSTDESTAIVTSAWSHHATAIDVASHDVLFSVDVPREPRGIAIARDRRRAWISHLTRGTLTRIDWAPEGSPVTSDVDLPIGASDDTDASLGWSLVIGGTKLFASRQDLSAKNESVWVGGVGSVDALRTDDDRATVPNGGRAWESLLGSDADWNATLPPLREANTAAAMSDTHFENAPRALAYAGASDTLLAGFSGIGEVIRFDARSLAPSRFVIGRSAISDCAGLSGIAISADEAHAWVHCAASFSIARIDLERQLTSSYGTGVSAYAYARDPLPELAAAGRRAFEDGSNNALSQGMPCAGCHPDGRDDGHVWAEAVPVQQFAYRSMSMAQLGLIPAAKDASSPRQTPMLAGRVDASGPYGWRGESKTLETRIEHGASIHRWFDFGETIDPDVARSIAAFLRSGLRAPHPPDRTLDEREARGKALFDGQAGCRACHATGATAKNEAPMTIEGFGEKGFKPPNLRFVGSTAPYYHDGSAPTLADLVRDNHDRMGSTDDLSEADRRALVAYLETL